MFIDFNSQSTAEILAVLKKKGLKIRAVAGKTSAPSKLEIKESKYSALLSELVELREYLAA